MFVAASVAHHLVCGGRFRFLHSAQLLCIRALTGLVGRTARLSVFFPALSAASVAFGRLARRDPLLSPLRFQCQRFCLFFTAKCLTACFQVLQKRKQPLVRC